MARLLFGARAKHNEHERKRCLLRLAGAAQKLHPPLKEIGVGEQAQRFMEEQRVGSGGDQTEHCLDLAACH